MTPISVHPRYGLETSAVVDDEAVEALRALGSDSDFFNDVIETFRVDARGIVEQLAKAAEEGISASSASMRIRCARAPQMSAAPGSAKCCSACAS